jgi:hypothetical protein
VRLAQIAAACVVLMSCGGWGRSGEGAAVAVMRSAAFVVVKRSAGPDRPGEGAGVVVMRALPLSWSSEAPARIVQAKAPASEGASAPQGA